MALYTALTHSVIQQLLHPYGLEVVGFRPIPEGNTNSSFYVKTGRGAFVLTLVEEEPVLTSLGLVQLLDRLTEHGFKTSEVVPTLDGSCLTTYQEKPVYLKKWIAGEVITDFNSSMLQQIGAELARLHQIPIPDSFPRTHPYDHNWFDTLIGRNVDPAYESWLQEQKHYIEAHYPNELPRGLIHGDLFFDNVLFDQGELQAIIDFEGACFHYCIFDIGMAIIGLCQEKGTINLAKAKAFIEGYQSIRTLQSLEKDKLLFFVEYAAIATSSWRYWKYRLDSVQEDRLDKHWEMVRLAQAVYSISLDDFWQAF